MVVSLSFLLLRVGLSLPFVERDAILPVPGFQRGAESATISGTENDPAACRRLALHASPPCPWWVPRKGEQPMTETYSFGEWVRRRRKALDLTQAALAAQVG